MYFTDAFSNGGSVQIPPFSCAEFMYFTDSAAPFFSKGAAGVCLCF
jgi:hypothetical protein